tara:strand:+ start:634 stop:975 length:342 start_codon:yes stop_codon:yes gene_type:complete
MKKEIIIDKENKVLILKVSIPRKILDREPNVRVTTDDAWEMVKSTKIKGYELLRRGDGHQPGLVDNHRHFCHDHDFIFPLREVAKPKPKAAPARKTPVRAKKPVQSKAEDAKD